MSNADVTSRARDFLMRQIDSFELMLGELAGLEADIHGDELERVATLQEAHRIKIMAMEAELQAVLTEWNSTHGLGVAEKAEIKALAQHARALAEQLVKLEDKGRDLADARLAALRSGLDDVARGRDVLDKYGQGSKGSSSFIDTKA